MSAIFDLTPEEEEYLASIAKCQNNLYSFVKEAWPEIEGIPFVDGKHIQVVCEHLEALHRGEIKNLLITLPPRCMKSALVGVIFPVWVWLHEPESQFLCVTNSQDLAFKGAIDSRNIITSPFYQGNWGHLYKLSADQNTKVRYANTAKGYRISCTFRGKITGRGGSYVICDDANHAFESDAERKKINEIWKSVLFNRVNDPETAKRIVFQQRTHEDDLAGNIIANDLENQWVKLILPMEFESSRRCQTIVLPSTEGKIWQDNREEGELLWPERFSKKEVNNLRTYLGSYLYAAQYQQRPAPEEGGLIQRSWFRVWTKKLPTIKYLLQSWDTALTANDTSSYSACTTWGTFEDENKVINLILISAWRGRITYPELLKRAIRLRRNCGDIGDEELTPNKQMQPDVTLVEAKASGHPLISDLNAKGIIVHSFNPDKYGDKMLRVHTATPFIECGRVWVISQELNDDKRLKQDHEMVVFNSTLFPNAESRDLVDTMTQAILYLSKVKDILTHVMGLNFDREKLPKEQMPGYVPERKRT